MPHLQEPMDLHATKSLPRRLLRLAMIVFITALVFVIGFAIAVIATAD
jgi:hypothetical protein